MKQREIKLKERQEKSDKRLVSKKRQQEKRSRAFVAPTEPDFKKNPKLTGKKSEKTI